MSDEFDLDGLSWMFQWDSYGAEADSFVQDVHLLVLDTQRAAIRRLNDEASIEDAELKRYLEGAIGKAAERLAEDQADLWIGVAQKERFLRNQALVSLMSSLTHCLLKMARAAEAWAGPKPARQPASKEDKGNDGRDEFKKIWKDYRERCGLDLGPAYIGFVDRYRRARNRIVHNGGEANPYLPFDQVDHEAGFDGMIDRSFSTQYPEFVRGEGFSAEIDVTDELLDKCVENSTRLTRHIAEQLRLKELEYAQSERIARFRTENPEEPLPV